MTHGPSGVGIERAGARRLVVLGTGTGVGKTWVTRTLARALRQVGASVVALKPIESGVGGDETDATLLARESSTTPSTPPFALTDPVSPHLAARRTGRSIELDQVVDYVARNQNAATSSVTSFVLVESAGGCLSPLSRGITNVDLALALDPALWLLVAPDALGVLHDVTATLAALAARGRSPDHLILSEARARDASTGTNGDELVSLGIATPTAIVRRDDEHALDAFARDLIEHAAQRDIPAE